MQKKTKVILSIVLLLVIVMIAGVASYLISRNNLSNTSALTGGSSEGGNLYVGYLTIINTDNPTQISYCNATLVDKRSFIFPGRCLKYKNYQLYFGIGLFSTAFSVTSNRITLPLVPKTGAYSAGQVIVSPDLNENDLIIGVLSADITTPFPSFTNIVQSTSCTTYNYKIVTYDTTKTDASSRLSDSVCINSSDGNYLYIQAKNAKICAGDSGAAIVDSNNVIVGYIARPYDPAALTTIPTTCLSTAIALNLTNASNLAFIKDKLNITPVPTATVTATATATVTITATATVTATATLTATPTVTATVTPISTLTPPPGTSSCQNSTIKTRFWYGCSGEPTVGCNGLTGWVQGSSVNISVIPTPLAVNCFTSDGAAYSNAKIDLFKDNINVASSTQFKLRDYSLFVNGNYKAVCTDKTNNACFSVESFTSNGVSATPTTTVTATEPPVTTTVAATTTVPPTTTAPPQTTSAVTSAPTTQIPSSGSGTIIPTTRPLPNTALDDNVLVKVVLGIGMLVGGIFIYSKIKKYEGNL